MNTQANEVRTIVATIKAKPEHVEQVKSELLKLTKASQAELGCIQYNLHQDNADLYGFTIYEVWKNSELLQQHAQSPHFQNYVKVTEGMVDDFVINEMTLIVDPL